MAHLLLLVQLTSDPTGIGFAFGGVEPGRLHAHGRPVDTHKVFFSVATCGNFLLYVGLRNHAMPLPGSPFALQVVPGPAHPLTTRLPTEAMPFRGIVGSGASSGYTVAIGSKDKLGNSCHKGGAKLLCTCPQDESMTIDVQDHSDGTYTINLRSDMAGTFDIHFTIDGAHIGGSPTTLLLSSDKPELSKTELYGAGLSTASAGKTASIGFRLKDGHGNICTAPSSFAFGLTLVVASISSEKHKWKTSKTDEYTGTWNREHEFDMKYTPTKAGELDLYVWLQTSRDATNPRRQLPGSPFRVACVADQAHAAGSFVGEYIKVESVADKAVKPSDPDMAAASPLCAGETILIKPQIRDQFGNPTAAIESDLRMWIISPDGEHAKLEVATKIIRAAVPSYEVSHEVLQAGDYSAHVYLGDAPIRGSPIAFKVEPSLPDVTRCCCALPEQPWYTETPYEISLVVADQYGNRCIRGGDEVTARLTSATMSAVQEIPQVTDRGDGTYIILVNIMSPCDAKLLITVASGQSQASASRAASSGELAPIQMQFVSRKAALAKAEREARALQLAESLDVEADDSERGAYGPESSKSLRAEEGAEPTTGGSSLNRPVLSRRASTGAMANELRAASLVPAMNRAEARRQRGSKDDGPLSAIARAEDRRQRVSTEEERVLPVDGLNELGDTGGTRSATSSFKDAGSIGSTHSATSSLKEVADLEAAALAASSCDLSTTLSPSQSVSRSRRGSNEEMSSSLNLADNGYRQKLEHSSTTSSLGERPHRRGSI